MRTLWRQVHYDLANDWKRSCKWWILLLLFLQCDAFSFTASIRRYVGNSGICMDRICYYWKMFGGGYPITAARQNVTVSVEYLLIGVLMLILATGYPSADYKSGGYRCMLACGSKWIWIASKYVHAVIKTSILYVLCIVSIEAHVIAVRTDDVISTQQVCEELLGFRFDVAGYTTYAMAMVGLSFILFALVYVTLDLFVGPLYTMLLGSAMLVGSYFVDSFLLFGNNLMMIRIANRPGYGIVPMLIVAALAVILGCWMIHEKDVLG